MNYKLRISNTKNEIEDAIGIPFKYPNIHKPRLVVDGLLEVTIPVITSSSSKFIEHAIWGILPENYEGEWKDFQDVVDTLQTNRSHLQGNVVYNQTLENRRCLIVVNGFYTSYLKGDKLESYLVEFNNDEPFFIAGVYNVIEDGFLTVSIINTKKTSFIESVQNLSETMPLIVSPHMKDFWLDENTELEMLESYVKIPNDENLSVKQLTA